MADYPTSLDSISQSQASKEVTANALFDSMSANAIFGRRASTSAGLTWGFYGGMFSISATPTAIANGTIALTASATNYLYVDTSGVVHKVTSAPGSWPGPLAAGAVALYEIIVGTSAPTSWIDYRLPGLDIAAATGPQGPQGASGAQGAQGAQGTQGTQGSQGSTGAGTQGAQGATGSQGPQGSVGAQGTQGTQGTTGAQGTQGTQGFQGGGGLDGIDGTSGQQGYQGGQGAQGTQGVQGAGSATESLIVACSDETTALAAGTGKVTFRMPYAFTLTAVRASLTTAQTSGSIFTVDINESGTTVISTKLTIDNTEKTSQTAATPPVISDASLADDAEMTVDIDQIGDGTAKGLKIVLIGHQ